MARFRAGPETCRSGRMGSSSSARSWHERIMPPTSRRVERNTAESVNRRIARETERRVKHLARHPEEIEPRLDELDREWDIERVLEANAASIGLAGTLLGAFLDRRFLVLPALVGGFLLQHAIQGWCPPVPAFRAAGVRTASEIDRERKALMALRGDFARLGPGEADGALSPEDRAARALAAAA